MLPENSAEIAAKAQMMGLRALVELLIRGKTEDTKVQYKRASECLQEGITEWEQSVRQGTPNFAVITQREKRLRDIELENIWENTTRYGNTETKRVRRERDGLVGPLNKLINTLGGILRNYALLMYPLDSPVKIGRQMNKTIWGYQSDSLGEVPVAHGADLPELDLADMIRSHGRKLCLKSFTFGVPPDAFNQYALLLIRRLSPYLNHVYTGGQCGNGHFLRSRMITDEEQEICADRVFGKIVNEIESLYGRSTGPISSPSKRQERDEKKPTRRVFVNQIERLYKESKQKPREKKQLLTWAQFLTTLLEKRILRDIDAQRLNVKAKNIVRYEGDRYHRLLTNGLPQLYNVSSVILEGDRFLQPGEDFLIIAESRIQTDKGAGRIDLAIFVRTEIPNPNRPGTLVAMKPIAVFEIKSQTALDWEIKSEKPEGKREKTVPRIIVRTRGLTEDEWNTAITEEPSERSSGQLELYTSGLLREYRRLTGDNTVSNLLKGVILVDTQFDPSLNRELMMALLKDIAGNQIAGGISGKGDRILIRSKSQIAKRIALILHSPKEEQLQSLRGERTALENEVVYNPFSEVEEKFVQHILYLSARTASNSGPTAAWIAQYWHGMKYLRYLSEEQGHAPVIWLDLAGIFGTKTLAKTRLRMHHHDSDMETFCDNITFTDLSSIVNGFLFEGANLPDFVRIVTGKKSGESQSIIVISGWDWVEDSLPPRLNSARNELERYLVQEIHRAGCTSVWFLEPRPDEMTSSLYHSRCLLPFWNTSPHRFHVTDIIWNLPVRPYASTHTTPMLDELRIIIHQTEKSITTEALEFPLLKNWSARFWSQRSKRRGRPSKSGPKGRTALTAKDALQNEGLKRELVHDAIDLIPWLRDLYPSEFKEEKEEEKKDITFRSTTLYGKPAPRSGIMSRMRYRAKIPKAKRARGYVAPQQLIPQESITHPRHYRRYRRREKPTQNKQIYRAPDERQLVYRPIREQTARNVEVRRFRQVVRLLSTLDESRAQDPAWRNMLRQLERILPDDRLPTGRDMNSISELLLTNDESASLWNSLLWIRERKLGDRLRIPEKGMLDSLLERMPHVTTTFGNYLFLFLVAVSKRFPDLRVEDLQTLWESVKSWHLKQIGFRLDPKLRDQSEHKFDVRAIWSNLCKRASTLAQIPLPVQSAVRYGQLLINAHTDEYDHWVFLEDATDKNRLHSGLFTGYNPLDRSTSLRWTESDNHEIADHASNVNPEGVYDLLISKIQDVEYVWLYAEEEWQLLGELVIIARRRCAMTSIRGMQVKSISSDISIDVPRGIQRSSTIGNRVREELSQLSRLRQHILSVQCGLGIEAGRYILTCEAQGEEVEKRVVSETSELLSLLRRPLVEGAPLQSSRNPTVHLTWNPYEDIDYGELQLLRPYVERRTPFVYAQVPLPVSSEELLERNTEEIDIIVSHDECECPIVDSSASTHGSCWRIRVDGKWKGLSLSTLTEDPLSDQDISSLLVAGEVFFEDRRYRLNIAFENDPKSREGIVFRESKKIARALEIRAVTPGLFLDLDSEKLKYILTPDQEGVQIGVYSTLTGERLASGASIPPQQKWEVEQMIQEFIDETETFIESYFGEGEAIKERAIDFEEVLEDLRFMLKRVKKRLPPR